MKDFLTSQSNLKTQRESFMQTRRQAYAKSEFLEDNNKLQFQVDLNNLDGIQKLIITFPKMLNSQWFLMK